MREIAGMVTDLVKNYETVKGVEINMPGNSKVIGSCPHCGADVVERDKGWFCALAFLSPLRSTKPFCTSFSMMAARVAGVPMPLRSTSWQQQGDRELPPLWGGCGGA